jgi:sec-independent protein translocase protein TatC
MGLVFEMPVLIFVLIRLGVVSRAWLAARRRYILLLSFIVAAVLTPTPDPINQSLVALPIYLLFELGLLLSRVGGGRRAAV